MLPNNSLINVFKIPKENLLSAVFRGVRRPSTHPNYSSASSGLAQLPVHREDVEIDEAPHQVSETPAKPFTPWCVSF